MANIRQRKIETHLALAALIILASSVVSSAGGQSEQAARKAMCKAHMSACVEDYGVSEVCNKGYAHCLVNGAFPIPESIIEPIFEDDCENRMRECRDPDWEPSATYSDGTSVQGDPIAEEEVE